MKNPIRAAILAILTVGVLIVVMAWFSAERTGRDAERFFREASRLTIASATADDVLDVVRSSNGQSNGFGPCISGEGKCIGSVLFINNRYFHYLHLVPSMVFSSWFQIDDGKLRSRWFQMSYLTPHAEIATFVHEGQSTQTIPNELIRTPEEKYFKISGGHPAGFLGVMITPAAPEELRELAYFNFQCLSKLSGCPAFEEMLPVLAKRELYWGQDPWLHESRR